MALKALFRKPQKTLPKSVTKILFEQKATRLPGTHLTPMLD